MKPRHQRFLLIVKCNYYSEEEGFTFYVRVYTYKTREEAEEIEKFLKGLPGKSIETIIKSKYDEQ